jgi:hypothetical protein
MMKPRDGPEFLWNCERNAAQMRKEVVPAPVQGLRKPAGGPRLIAAACTSLPESELGKDGSLEAWIDAH